MNNVTDFFESSLKDVDIDVYEALKSEWKRQQHHIELIASENIASRAVLDAVGSVSNNKYAEGYPGRRYYGGCEHIDVIESLAIERVCKLFDCEFANVQPHSGSQANQAVFMSLMQPGDCFLGLSLAEGGHLTHGAKPNVSGKWFKPIHYGVDAKTHLINYDQVLELAREHKPKVIIAGASAYPRVIDFKRMREIADETGAFLMVDMAHIAGLVATGCHPSPLPHAHVVTSTTHKTLRGARGGLILTNDAAIIKKVNSAIFPGLQGGPLEQQVAGKAVAFKEALSPSFRQYGKQIVANAHAMVDSLKAGGIDMVSGGTDTHLILIDLRKQELTGTAVEVALESLGIVCNKNGVPNDPQKPTVTSGIRIGTPAITSRGFKEKEATETADILVDTIKQLAEGGEEAVANSAEQQRQRVRRLTDAFPIYSRMPSS